MQTKEAFFYLAKIIPKEYSTQPSLEDFRILFSYDLTGPGKHVRVEPIKNEQKEFGSYYHQYQLWLLHKLRV